MTLITSWRKAWKSDYMPFYYVQIAPFNYQVPEQGEGIREGQRRAMRLPETGMVVTMDAGDSDNIHPAEKKTPGERLAKWALANTYGQNGMAFSGPLLKEHVIEGNKVRLSFHHASGGLASSDGLPLRHFYLEDISGSFFPAEAYIDGETLLLSSPSVSQPVSVRYAYGNVFDANFINKDTLPASPFRTHNDETITSPRYFDATGGDDRNDGLSPFTAWRNIDTINSLRWSAGAEILLKCNENWTGQICLRGNGTKTNPIKVTSYGEGKFPLLNGSGESYTLKIENSSYWEISNIEIVNFGSGEENMSLDEWELNNTTYWCNGNSLPPFEESRTDKFGILVTAGDMGEVTGFHFQNLKVHGINGNIKTKDNGGIFFEITGSSVPTWFNDIRIEKCHIYDVDRTGISNQSSWSVRSRTDNEGWYTSKHIIIRNIRFERTGANALIVRVADSPLIEHNLFRYCAIKESGNACFSFNCDNALWQYNEACYTKYNKGDDDAGGFDSDYKCKNTVIRYNYSHHNEYGGILVCCMGGSDRFNTGTLVCYNLFINNEDHTVRVSGTPEETTFLNNIIFSSVDDSTDILWHKNWSGFASRTKYLNNIFYLSNGKGLINLGASTGNSFKRNIFYGVFGGNMPPGIKHQDPIFTVYPLPADPEPYMFTISDMSPAIDRGVKIKQRPYLDYFGNVISGSDLPDIGIHENK
ncbi:MAG: hypothetical protein E4G92_02125 [Bacteroidia bacterium]|nr:MAG: hypothetical protein E4G92_02125 [Bacteroidia bacterium]